MTMNISTSRTMKAVLASLLMINACIAFAIEPPKNPRGIVKSPTEVQWEWDWVNGATRFEITVDGEYKGEATGTSFVSKNLWPGDHSFTVKAINKDWIYSDQSITAKVNTKNSAPTNNNNNNNNNAQNNNNNGNNNDSQPATSSNGVAIPQNLRAEEVEPKTLKWQWDWTPGASKYEVTVDGKYAGETSDTQFFSRDLWVGDHSLTVKSINSSGQYSQASNTLKKWVSGNANTANNDTAAPPPPQNDASGNDATGNNGNQDFGNDGGLIDPASWQYGEVYQKEGYELSFSDEFNSYSLNPNRWNTQLRWDGEFNGERDEYRVINGEKQFYVNTLGDSEEHRSLVLPQHNPFEFNGSRLAIRAIKNPLKNNDNRKGHGPLREMVSQQHFLSGALSTYDKFVQKYGYFEARIKIPSHTGTFPAFWLHHQKRKYEGSRRSEIDIMENLGHAPWYIYNTFHYFTNVSATYGGEGKQLKPQPDGQIFNGTNYSENYHTYAVEWAPGRVTWFIDGEKVSELYNGAVDYEELYVILNLAMGGNWTNYDTNSGGLGRSSDNYYPNQDDLNNFSNPALEIDYVRVYKRK